MDGTAEVEHGGSVAQPPTPRVEATVEQLSQRICHEHKMYWSRSSTLMAMSAGMMALLSSGSIHPGIVRAMFAVLAAAVSVAWLVMGTMSLRWIRFWEQQLVQHERLLPAPHAFGDYRARTTDNYLIPGIIEGVFLLVSSLFVIWSLVMIFIAPVPA